MKVALPELGGAENHPQARDCLPAGQGFRLSGGGVHPLPLWGLVF